MAITFPCTSCEKRLKAPEELAGKKIHCPACGTLQSVPDEIFEAEPLPAPGASTAATEPEAAGYSVESPPPAVEKERRPCPLCGEMILANAVKCRFCGEVFDETLRKAERKKRGGATEDSDLTAAEWVLAILCSGIGCIVGIVWMIQGKAKGPKMIGISLAFAVLWSIVRFALEAAVRR